MDSKFIANLSDANKIKKLPAYIGILQSIIREQQGDTRIEIYNNEVIPDHNEEKNFDVYSTLKNDCLQIDFNMYDVNSNIDELKELKKDLNSKSNENKHYAIGAIEFTKKGTEKYIELYVPEDHDHVGGTVSGIKICLENPKILKKFVEYVDQLINLCQEFES